MATLPTFFAVIKSVPCLGSSEPLEGETMLCTVIGWWPLQLTVEVICT